MVTSSLIFYALSVIIAVAAFIGIRLAFKVRKKRLSLLHMLIGGVGFAIMLVLMFVLMMLAFSDDAVMYITAYFTEGIYKVTVGLLFFAAIGVIRYFSLNAAYFNRDKSDEGESFLAGYGFCGCALIALYSLFMFCMLATASFSSELTTVDENAFYFADGSVISAFASSSSVMLVCLVIIVYTVLCMIIGEFMSQHAALPYKKGSTLLVYILTALCELIMICTFVFAITSISTIAIVIISVLFVVLAALAVILLYKYKEELPYEKQFD